MGWRVCIIFTRNDCDDYDENIFIVYFCDINEQFMNSVLDIFLNKELRNTDIA